MRKFCWVYRSRLTRRFVVVQRPHRRASPRIYAIKPRGGRVFYAPDSVFKKKYEYVGSLRDPVLAELCTGILG